MRLCLLGTYLDAPTCDHVVAVYVRGTLAAGGLLAGMPLAGTLAGIHIRLFGPARRLRCTRDLKSARLGGGRLLEKTSSLWLHTLTIAFLLISLGQHSKPPGAWTGQTCHMCSQVHNHRLEVMCTQHELHFKERHLPWLKSLKFSTRLQRWQLGQSNLN